MSRINGVVHPTLIRGEGGTATVLLCISILDGVCTNLPESETSHHLFYFFSYFQETTFIKNACTKKKSINLC